MRAWTLTEKETDIGLEEQTVLTPKFYNYPFNYLNCKDEANYTGWFAIKYADFHGGDVSSKTCETFEEAV